MDFLEPYCAKKGESIDFENKYRQNEGSLLIFGISNGGSAF